jgi:hypothetical protein
VVHGELEAQTQGTGIKRERLQEMTGRVCLLECGVVGRKWGEIAGVEVHEAAKTRDARFWHENGST